MTDRSHKIWLALIMTVAAALLWYGWRTFWFMTDDALIAFRYVSNSILGYGYVWNPPPFMPVEGYTSFLWVGLLDIIWRVFDLEPPQVVNYLSLFFSGLTLLLTARIVSRMSLGAHFDRFRLPLLALVFLGILSNRTFLAWTSSGLETAMFNFFLTAWIVVALFSQRRGTVWLFGLTGTATLVYLTRPDGLLVLSATLLLVGWHFYARWRHRELSLSSLVGMTPLLLPIIHLTWRQATYGEWLPNTYYAKHVAAWPESGLRYIASFVLEYGLWLWLIVLLWWLIRMIAQTKTVRLQITDFLKAARPASERQFTLLVIIGTVAAHVGYYTLIIGGDHFEYRVFSYLIPFIFLTMLWMLSRLTRDRVILACALGLFILVSWPIGWVHWQQSQKMITRDATWIMKLKIAPKFPTGFKWYAETFDDLQAWLIERHVCMRHQEHKIFYEYFSGQFPARSELDIPRAGKFPVIQYGSVGVPGWVFPKVAVIDRFGLNDYIIARHPVPPGRIRKMAHDRYAPAGYWGSFAPNYGLLINRSAGFVQRDFELTAAEIEATEKYWVDYVVHDIKAPMSYLMLCRIGESLIRTRQLDTAMSALEAAIAADSTEARAYFDLASCMEKKSEYDSALALLQVADRCDPGNHKIRSREGVVLAGLGYDSFESDHDLARDYFTRSETLLFAILEGVGDHAEALVGLASMNLFLDRIDSSAVFLNRLEAGLEPSPGALHLLGDRYIFKKRRDLAIRAYRLAIRNGLNVNVKTVLANKYPELSAPK